MRCKKPRPRRQNLETETRPRRSIKRLESVSRPKRSRPRLQPWYGFHICTEYSRWGRT